MTLAMNRIAVIVSCFNRKATTLNGLESLFAQQGIERFDLTVFLVDDASTDGTPEAVAERFPSVRILRGNGSLWWAGAMRVAYATAMAEGFDGYIWWNDDTLLMPDALERIVACAQDVALSRGPAIIAGSTCDNQTGLRSYGAYLREASGLKIDFIPLEPDPLRAIPAVTMNGNFTLVPDAIARKLGNLEAGYRHQRGDFDYGLRATKLGIPVILAPGFYGRCSDNPTISTWRDPNVPLSKRWKSLMSPKGAPPDEWLLYTRRHYGWRWPLYFISPYLKVLLNLAR